MFFLVVSISFIVELGERLLPLGSVDQIFVEGVVDAALLSLTLAPVLYLLTYRPWQKEVARRLSAQRDRDRVVELSADIIASIGPDGLVVDINRATERMLGWSPGELVGKRVIEFVHPEDCPAVIAGLRGISGEPGTTYFPCRILCKDGSYRWIEWLGELDVAEGVIRGVGRDVTKLREAEDGLKGAHRDLEWRVQQRTEELLRANQELNAEMREREQVERTLRESEERYRTLAEVAPDAVFVVNREGHVEYVNKRGAELMGLAHEQVFGQRYQSLFPPEHAARHWANMHKVFESGESLQVEGWTQVGGRVLWQHTSLVPLHDASGEARAILSVARDLTDRKRGEQALAGSEARFRAIFERTTVGIIVMDVHGRVVEVNRAIQRILAYSRDELIGLDFREVTHPDDVVVQLPLHEELVGGKREYYVLDKRYVRKDGTIRWAHVMVSIVDYASGRFILGLVEDVTERWAAIEDLGRAKEDCHRMFESVHPAMLLDPQHRILVVNEATSRASGMRAEECVGRKCYEIFHGTDQPIEGCPMERALWSKQAETKEVTFEVWNRRCSVWCNPMLAGTGEVECVIHVATDVTERVQAEETLRDYEMRLRAVFETVRFQRTGKFEESQRWDGTSDIQGNDGRR